MNLLEEKIKKKYPVYVVAHRGANAECPENSMLAFENAVEIGADMIEFDIHKTTDNEIVVIHDANAKKVSGVDLNVELSSFEEVSQVEMEKGQRIPKLDELFEKLKGKIGFQVEIKQEGLTDLLWDKIKKFGVESSVVISSFIHGELSKFKQKSKEIPLMTLEPFGKSWVTSVFSKKGYLKNAKNSSAHGIHPFYKFVNADLIKEAHAAGLVVNPWTVDKVEDWDNLIKLGVDGIITNDPRNLIKYLDEKK